MNKTLSLIQETLTKLYNEANNMPDTPELDKFGSDEGGGEQDIAEPDPEQQAPPEDETPAPLTSKGEEYLLKLAYLALLFTPKDEEMVQIKNTFESSGIHDENSIQAEDPQSIENTKNIIVNILGANNSTRVASQLNDIPEL